MGDIATGRELLKIAKDALDEGRNVVELRIAGRDTAFQPTSIGTRGDSICVLQTTNQQVFVALDALVSVQLNVKPAKSPMPHVPGMARV